MAAGVCPEQRPMSPVAQATVTSDASRGHQHRREPSQTLAEILAPARQSECACCWSRCDRHWEPSPA